MWRRARDLSLLSPEGIMDLPQLAYSLYAADVHSGNMVTQAAPASTLTIPRAYDSTILALKSPPPPPGHKSAPAAASAAGIAGVAAAAAASQQRISAAAAGAGIQGGGGAAGVIDLRAAELSSPVMVEALAGVRKRCGHDGWVGLQRYLLHVPTLHREWRAGGGGGRGSGGGLEGGGGCAAHGHALPCAWVWWRWCAGMARSVRGLAVAVIGHVFSANTDCASRHIH